MPARRAASRVPDSQALARAAARLTLTKRAEEVMILDLRELDGVCDFFVLATGSSEVQVRAIADAVEDGLRPEGTRPWHVEGYEARKWILLDYVDVVVHVFHAKAREYYLLDKLWGDAPRELVAD
ncbi:MAG TPA: ribosome silencing factor [Candidatus Limnocylindrales bacterium]|nr:ribosome silencing factor [Candidatus Limnocylindrales bacterium]